MNNNCPKAPLEDNFVKSRKNFDFNKLFNLNFFITWIKESIWFDYFYRDELIFFKSLFKILSF